MSTGAEELPKIETRDIPEIVKALSFDNLEFLQNYAYTRVSNKFDLAYNSEHLLRHANDLMTSFEYTKNPVVRNYVIGIPKEDRPKFDQAVAEMMQVNPFEDYSGRGTTPETILSKMILARKRMDFKDLVVDAKMSADMIRDHMLPYIEPQVIGFKDDEEMKEFFSLNDITARSFIAAFKKEGYSQPMAERSYLEFAIFNHLFPADTDPQKRTSVLKKLKMNPQSAYYSRYHFKDEPGYGTVDIHPEHIASALKHNTFKN